MVPPPIIPGRSKTHPVFFWRLFSLLGVSSLKNWEVCIESNLGGRWWPPFLSCRASCRRHPLDSVLCLETRILLARLGVTPASRPPMPQPYARPEQLFPGMSYTPSPPLGHCQTQTQSFYFLFSLLWLQNSSPTQSHFALALCIIPSINWDLPNKSQGERTVFMRGHKGSQRLWAPS